VVSGRYKACASKRIGPVSIAAIAAVSLLSVLSNWPVIAQSAGPVRASERQCMRVVLNGEVAAGEVWRAEIGQGWLIRLVPVCPSAKDFTGWDLVINPAKDSNYPDALLLATPPYSSLSEREIATTFGLRAQDAIAWTPRKFHFLDSDRDLAAARELFKILVGPNPKASRDSAADKKSTGELLSLIEKAAPGEFRVLDAQLATGVADPPAFARQWATQLNRVPHTLVPSKARATPLGELKWIRFSIILWLPLNWKIPAELRPITAKCAQ